MQNESLNENEINIDSIDITETQQELETGTIQEVPGDPVTLETIHQDLGFICSFLVIAAVLIFMTMIYKLLKIFF